MNSTFANITDGSTFSMVQQDHKKKQPEKQLICGEPFEQLFAKQRTYIQSEEVKAIQEYQRKQKSISEVEFEMVTSKPSKEIFNNNYVRS